MINGWDRHVIHQMILIPYWVLVVFVTLRVVLAKQRVQQLADSLVVSPDDWPIEGVPLTAAGKGAPAGILRLDGGNGIGAIALADITHVTVEDHYCRINYTTGNGLKSEMIRLPLKQMLGKLPEAYFVHIHRSRVVNMGHVSRITKSGRDHKVIGHFGTLGRGVACQPVPIQEFTYKVEQVLTAHLG